MFGLDKEDIAHPELNYAGIVVSILGLGIYLQVESKATSAASNEADANNIESKYTNTAPLLSQDEQSRNSSLEHIEAVSKTGNLKNDRDTKFLESIKGNNVNDTKLFGSWSESNRRLLGLSMAAVTGALFGCSFNPAQYVIDHDYDGDDSGLNYVFPQFCGILLSSWSYTILYFIYKEYKGETPFVNYNLILPATGMIIRLLMTSFHCIYRCLMLEL